MKSTKNNKNQKSFFFDDFLEITQRNKKLNKFKIYEDRLYALFSLFDVLLFFLFFID